MYKNCNKQELEVGTENYSFFIWYLQSVQWLCDYVNTIVMHENSNNKNSEDAKDKLFIINIKLANSAEITR